MKYQGEYYMPIFNFYPETTFGGDLPIEAQYRYDDIQCLIVTGGVIDCYDDPETILAEVEASGTALGEPVNEGWVIWPIIPYKFDTIVDIQGAAPSPPDGDNWLGTDDTKRDVVARVLYGFRLSILFTIIVTVSASIIGVAAGAAIAGAVGAGAGAPPGCP